MYVYKQKGTGRFAFALTNMGNKLNSRKGVFSLVCEVSAKRESQSGYICRKKLEAAQRGQDQSNGEVSGDEVIATDLFGQFQVITKTEFLALC